MKEKEAREIIRKEKASVGLSHVGWYRAAGYLQALEKAKILEEALKKISNSSFDRNGRWTIELDLQSVAKEALAEWEKGKK